MSYIFQALLASGQQNVPIEDVELAGITKLVTLGDSIAAGSNASPSTNAFREKLKDLFLWTDTNLAVGGRGYYNAIESFNETTFTRANTITIDETGLNDVRRSWNAKTRNKIRASIDSILARLAGLNAAASGSASVTRTGTFSAFDARAVGGVYGTGTLPGNFASQSSTTNSEWEWDFNTDSFFIAFMGSDGTAARGPCEVYVDDVLIDTITNLNQSWDGVSDGANNNQQGPDTRVYWGFGVGAHTCRVKVTGTDPVVIDRFVEMDTPENVGVFFLIEAPKVVDYNKPGLDNANDVVMNILNRIRTNRLNIFNSRGYRFYYIPIMSTSGGFYKLPDDIDPADDVHPTNQGHEHIYDSIIRFTHILLHDTFDGSSGSVASHTPNIGGAWTVRSGTVTINGSGRLVASVTGNITQTTTESDVDSAVLGRITTTNNAINLIFRYTDENNYIQVQFVVNGASSSLILFNRVAGVNNNITSVVPLATNYAINVDHRLKVLLVANRIQVWIGDTLEMDYTDSDNNDIAVNNPTGVIHGLRVTTVASIATITMV